MAQQKKKKKKEKKKEGNLKRENESLLIAAQNNAIRTNHLKARIDYNKPADVGYVVIEMKRSIP